MSRVGKKPVDIPGGVQTRIEGQTITAKGPKGELSFAVPEEVEVKAHICLFDLYSGHADAGADRGARARVGGWC